MEPVKPQFVKVRLLSLSQTVCICVWLTFNSW